MVEKVLLRGLEQTCDGFVSQTPMLTLPWSGFSWVWVLSGLAPSLGFSLMERDVEQDLDWTVAGNQSKTVTGLKCFCFLFKEGF